MMHKLRCQHKQSLEKLKYIRHHLSRKADNIPSFLDVTVHIAALYLHLGSIDRSLRYAKEAIDHSTTHAFPDEKS